MDEASTDRSDTDDGTRISTENGTERNAGDGIARRPRRRWAAVCGAAVAAAFFTPVPATADVIPRAAPDRQAAVPSRPDTDTMAQSLISTGMIGIGLAMGGLVIVTHHRRQW